MADEWLYVVSEAETSIVRRTWGHPDERLVFYRVTLNREVRDRDAGPFGTKADAARWAEARICEIDAARELAEAGIKDADELTRGTLTRRSR